MMTKYSLLAKNIWGKNITNQNSLLKDSFLNNFLKKDLVRAVCSESCTYGSGSIY